MLCCDLVQKDIIVILYCIQKAHDTDAAALSVISVSIAALFTLAFVYNVYSSSLRVLAVKRRLNLVS